MAKRKAWTEPAVGWGVRAATKDGGNALLNCFSYDIWDPRDDATLYVRGRPIRVAIVPLAAARKAGLLKRPK